LRSPPFFSTQTAHQIDGPVALGSTPRGIGRRKRRFAWRYRKKRAINASFR
jgi:hypothetical protein